LYIRTWARTLVSAPEQSILAVFPSRISFARATIGAAPVSRNLLVTSNGAIPAFLEDVRVTAGAPEFRIASVPAWPGILAGGDSLVVTIEFAPDVPPGIRNGTVTVISNGGRQLDVPLLALALPSPSAAIRIRPPDLLNFGVVVAGQQREASVDVFNDGDVSLQLAPPRIEGDAALVRAFGVVAAALSIAPQGSNTIALAFRPPRGGPANFNARLILDSNDPNHPQSTLPLLAVAAEGTLLVLPANLNFGPTPIDADIPPLPQGLPPTVHRGSTSAVTLYNTGAAGLTILAASFQVTDANGAPSADYHLWKVDGSVVAQVNQPLAAGGIYTLVVQFLPITAGLHPASLQISSDDPTQPRFTVNITGTGVA
jgi:hypothetical protein